MFIEVSKAMYRQILQLEVAFLMEYKIDPFQLFARLSMLDITSYVRAIEVKLEEQQKQKSKAGGKDFGKCLMAIRDILNYMFTK